MLIFSAISYEKVISDVFTWLGPRLTYMDIPTSTLLTYKEISYLVLSCLILSYLILSYLILSYLILSYLILSV